LSGDTLEAQFAALEQGSSLDAELAALKARRSAELPAPQAQKQLEAPEGP
jgi:phage shock protein A